MNKIEIVDMTIGKIGEVEKNFASCVIIMLAIPLKAAMKVDTKIGGRTYIVTKRYIIMTALLIFKFR